MTIDQRLNRILGSLTGFNIKRVRPNLEDVRRHVLSSGKIETVIDGGANEGQWAEEVLNPRFGDYDVISFEPIEEVFGKLQKRASNRPNWKVNNCALGAENGKRFLNISSNGGQSSSLMEFDFHSKAYPGVSMVRREEITVRRLDGLVDDERRFYLKLDVQGFEKEALEGATSILKNVVAIEIETAFMEMYSGQQTHYQIIPHLIGLGFRVHSISTPATMDSGRVTYVDVLLLRDGVLD